MYGTTKHFYMLNTQALVRRRFFPIISLWQILTPRGMVNLDPRGMVGRIYEEDYQTLLHTKYRSSGSCGFREDVFSFS